MAYLLLIGASLESITEQCAYNTRKSGEKEDSTCALLIAGFTNSANACYAYIRKSEYAT
jgi:hypothetical protein